jgi:hypothetical protein
VGIRGLARRRLFTARPRALPLVLDPKQARRRIPARADLAHFLYRTHDIVFLAATEENAALALRR